MLPMKQIFFLFTFFMAAVGIGDVVLADAPRSPVVVLDMQRVLNESVAGKAARNNLEDEAKKRRVKVDEVGREVKKLQEELQKQSTLLSGTALEGRKELLEKRQKEYTRLLQDLQEDFTRRNNAEVEKLVKEVDMLVKKIAVDRKYSFILERDLRFVIFATPELDLTDEIIHQLDARKLDL